MGIRAVSELVDVSDPAWDEIRALAEGSGSATVLDIERAQGEEVLWRLQVTARSYLGALALNTGGLLVDHGWFRLLGGGSPRMLDLASANDLGDPTSSSASPPSLLVAYDALGGRFAIDGGGLGVAPGEVCYFGPDSLAWGGLGGGHAQFVTAVIDGTLSATFADLRWANWEQEVESLSPDQALSIFPPPFTKEGRDIASASRRPVPVRELFGFLDEAASQLG